MYIAFDKISAAARIWIYQANRALNEDEERLIHQQTPIFLEKWAAHGANLKTSYDIRYQRFLILSVDESFNSSSGCSIDSSVHFIQQLGHHLNIDFFDRNMVAFFKNGEIETKHLTGLKTEFENGNINGDSLVFNNLITSVGDIQNNWIIPVKDSWLKKYLKDTVTN